MGWSVLDTFLQHLTWSLGGGWSSLFSLLQVACSQIRQVGSLCGESEGKRRSHFTCSQHWCLFTSSSRWGRISCGVFPGLPERSAAELGSEPLHWERRVRGRALEPPGGRSVHCSQIGKPASVKPPKLAENTLLRNTSLFKFVRDNSLNSLGLSSLKD